MDLSAAAHHQHPFSHQLPEFSSSPIQESSPSLSLDNKNQEAEQKKPKAPETEPQQCPRCESTNTKFCYFNNYSLTQPRYFCKACRRYWTKGGTLRNVPVGGGCRKSAKRPASNSPNQYLKRPHTVADTNPNLHGYSAGMLTPNYSDAGMLHNNYFSNQHNFLQELNNYSDGGAFMFQNSLCNNYDEIVAGNSNSGSVISDEMAALAPYGGVKQESVENAAFWELPWQNGEVEPVRDNWNGLYANYSVLGLLNSPALM